MAAKRISLRIAGYQPAETVHTRAVREFQRCLALHPDEISSVSVQQSVIDLGHKTADLVDLVATGQYDIAYISSIYFTDFVPALLAFEVPFLLRSRPQALELLDSRIRPRLDQVQDRMPVRVLAIWDNGVRQISTNARPIRTPEDCRGLTLRTQRSPLISRSFQLLGFETTWIDIGKLLSAIRDGTIDAQENPLVNICGFHVDDLHQFICMTSHLFGVTFLICNPEAYASWSPTARDAVQQAAEQATHFQRRIAAEQDAELKTRLIGKGNQIVTLEPEERLAFARAVAPIRDEYPDIWKDKALDGFLDF